MSTWLRPKVTVVIPFSSERGRLRHTLQSVLSQTFRSFEVWVIGDGRGALNEERILTVSDARVFACDLPAPSTHTQQILAGLRRARGEFVAYLNPDDVWLPTHLEVLLHTVETSDADLVFSIIQHLHSDKHSTLNIPLVPELPVLPDLSSVLHRAALIVDLGLLRTEREFIPGLVTSARKANLRMEVSGRTTGLRFLSLAEAKRTELQQSYIEKFTRDPDFVNEELSTILLRKELDHLRLVSGRGWTHWFNGSWSMVIQKLWHNSKRMIKATD